MAQPQEAQQTSAKNEVPSAIFLETPWDENVPRARSALRINGPLDDFGRFGRGKMWSRQNFALANRFVLVGTNLPQQLFATSFGKPHQKTEIIKSAIQI